MAVGKGSILRATNAVNSNGYDKKDINEEIKSIGNEIVKDNYENTFLEVPLSQIKSVPKSWLPKKVLKSQVDELTLSIKKYGLLEPVILRKLKDNQFQLLSGYKRMESVKENGENSILARVLEEMSDSDAKGIYEELHKNSNINNIHELKYQVISSIQSDMPEYLL